MDPKCLDHRRTNPFLWSKVQTDEAGPGTTELLFPSLAIATLLFHPRNWPHMHRRAAEVCHPRFGDGCMATK